MHIMIDRPGVSFWKPLLFTTKRFRQHISFVIKAIGIHNVLPALSSSFCFDADTLILYFCDGSHDQPARCGTKWKI